MRWRGVSHAGIGSVWLLLARLTDIGALPTAARHTREPPHFLELLRRLSHARHEARQQPPSPTFEKLVGGVGWWAVPQGRHARAVIEFFGRMVVVCGQMFRRPRALRVTSLTRHITRPVSPPFRSCR